jgi:hypothetical protein
MHASACLSLSACMRPCSSFIFAALIGLAHSGCIGCLLWGANIRKRCVGWDWDLLRRDVFSLRQNSFGRGAQCAQESNMDGSPLSSQVAFAWCYEFLFFGFVLCFVWILVVNL